MLHEVVGVLVGACDVRAGRLAAVQPRGVGGIDRTANVRSAAYFRRVLDERVLPGPELTDLTRFGPRRTFARPLPGQDPYPWYAEQTSADAEGTEPVTFVSIGWLDTEAVATPQQCPRCERVSRSHNPYAYLPGTSILTAVRTCRSRNHI
ncbi:hypothetical protein [Streptomyces sp. WAC01280]|uniref:hypothetical protein n=1 Tax=Streptomyces sp. WAC01280 TaxID=2487424 RepID=UPI000F78BC87|nr:hypothetical protein [Streptomyces sp. WAC01280]RSS57393.1 hypothetical protein EF909_15610 [Streptomyces sp. WAC01280]